LSKAILYFRCSSDEQAKSGLGLEAQAKACRAYAKRLGLTQIIEFADEGISGSKEIAKRPSLSAALASLEKGDTFIVYKLDRLSRAMYITFSIQQFIAQKGCFMRSVAGEGLDSTGIDGLIQSTFASLFSQVEREHIRQRTKAALNVKRSRGERIGAIPYGFKLARDRKTLKPCEKETKVIRTIVTMRKRGCSYRDIVTRLNKTRIPTRTGSPWRLTQVVRIIQKHANATSAKTAANA
jgi:site-specific DNA recombinase